MKIVAVANLKGGVGKSTTTLFLAEHWALKGKRVLVIDLDPQANASFMLLSRRGVERCEVEEKTLPHLFLHSQNDTRRPALAYIEARASDLMELRPPSKGFVSLMPSVPRLWIDEYDFDRSRYQQNDDPVQARLTIFRELLADIKSNYDCVLLDCPPGFSTLTRSALRLADKIISPTIADHVSVRSLGDFVAIGLDTLLGPQGRKRLGVVVSKYSPTTDQAAELDLLKKNFSVLGSPIPLRDQVVKATRCAETLQRTYAQKYDRPIGSRLGPHVRNMCDAVYKAVFES